MTRRTIWTTAFLTITAAAVGMELWAANDHSPDTVPWTQLIVDHVPAVLTTAAIGVLVAWLPAHFASAYAKSGGSGMGKYAKFVAATAAAVLAVLTALTPVVAADKKPWVEAVIAGLGALTVYGVPNSQPEGE